MIKTTAMSAIALAVLLSACGKSGESTPAAPAAPPAPPSPATSAAPTPAPAPAPPSAPATTAAADTAPGMSTYNKVCALCHAAGVGGAPKPGDKADWGPRIGQGKDVLYKHALEGFTGQKGMMPPRGGSPALKDDEVKAAVDYMVSKSE
ncbi:c-type cytochrome [Aromatoleum toluolicum]|uniref:C-type cytochrome n=1 Tax=Aromatoleum toluolicum TaxID=90060 RepID=A0ABX1NJQ0_9RHOO|nr:c-type cytochrome [Aromatoleum toluolicum]NMF99494.1 c-type cytochrome [Aromatoleum toluolicum]